ncbi:MAG: hypothetical protein N838_09315 [Thiohalocapsa sp. PB-PSB1]|nr:MAG: hypothetical protein N838_09315 [Thiohalocapsa sp. PB-PSB1]
MGATGCAIGLVTAITGGWACLPLSPRSNNNLYAMAEQPKAGVSAGPKSMAIITVRQPRVPLLTKSMPRRQQ